MEDKKETPPNKGGRRPNDTLVGVVEARIPQYTQFVKPCPSCCLLNCKSCRPCARQEGAQKNAASNSIH